MSRNKILIPVDFTPVAKSAISYAVQVAKEMKAVVHLLHIVKNQEEVNPAEELVKKWAAEVDYEHVEASVRIGTIFEDISDFAAELHAKLVVMGTHGKRGMQKITGSWALKIISNSKVPFLVVQEKTVPKKIENIVFPIDMQKESKEKLKITAFYAKVLNAKVHIFVRKSNDKFLLGQINANVKAAKRFFDENKVRYDITVDKEDDFVEDLINYTVKSESDVIAIVNLNYKNFTNIFGNREEDLLFNDAKVPVLIMTPNMDHMYATVLQNF